MARSLMRSVSGKTMGMDVRSKHVTCLAIDVIGRGNDPEGYGDPTVPIVRWRHRRPPNVIVSRFPHAPYYPSWRVGSSRYPRPTPLRYPNPAPVVENRPPPCVVRHPNPVPLLRHTPIPSAHIRDELRAYHLDTRNPNEPVIRVFHPHSIGRQLLPKHFDCRRIRVSVV